MFVIYTPESTDVGRVTQIMFLPTTEQKTDENGIDLGSVSMVYPDNIPGMDSVLKINLQEKVLFYDYYAIETLETKLSDLQKENAELNLTIGNLVLESANDKATIASLEETVGTLLLEVATLKGGAA